MYEKSINMHTHTEQCCTHHTAAELFALVADVEKYPEFLPWVKTAHIHGWEDEHTFTATLTIAFKTFRESYTSRVTLTRPEDNESSEYYRIDVALVEGPFKHLHNTWVFTPQEGGGACIDFTIDFDFKSKMLSKVIGALFKKATDRMVDAFMTRADAVCGRN